MNIRMFIAVDIGPLVEVVKFEEDLLATGSSLKLVEPENIHITLKFLGDTDEELIAELVKNISEASKEIKPFNLRFYGAGAFPNLNYIKILWIGIQNYAPLEIIANNLDNQLKKLGFQPEKRSFKAHITIARVKSAKNKNSLKELLIANKSKHFAEFHVDTIRLKKSVLSSKGPTYYTLGEVKLI